MKRNDILLSQIENGEVVIIKEIMGNRKNKKRLMEMGCLVNEEIMVEKNINGSLLIIVKGSKIAIGTEFSNKIIVERNKK